MNTIEQAMADIRASEPEPCLHMLDYWLQKLGIAARACNAAGFARARRRALEHARRAGYA